MAEEEDGSILTTQVGEVSNLDRVETSLYFGEFLLLLFIHVFLFVCLFFFKPNTGLNGVNATYVTMNCGQ